MARAGRATRGEHIVTMVLGSWVLLGLLVDGWAHTRGTGPESFLTPWHGLFYSGFVAAASWVAWLVQRRQRAGLRGRPAIPRHHGLTLAGLVVFAVGVVGDLLWHTTLGIEQGLRQLFSPSHLLLLTGIVLIMSTPLRDAWAEGFGTVAPSLRIMGPALASTVLVTTTISFSLLFLGPFQVDVAPEWIGRVADPTLVEVVAAATALAAGLPLLLWSIVYLLHALTDGIGLVPEIWTGAIMWASLTGVLLGLCIAPPDVRERDG